MRELTFRSMFLLVFIFFVSSCSSEGLDDPLEAKTCIQLVEAGKVVAERVLAELSDETFVGLEERSDSNEFLIYIAELMRTEDFKNGALNLGCQDGDLKIQGCRTYKGIFKEKHGELARQYLAPYFEFCS